MIRKAVITDLPQISEDLLNLHEISTFKTYSVDRERMDKNLKMFMCNKQYNFMVDDRDGVIGGFIVGAIDNLWFSADRYATDLLFHATYGGAGARLARAFIKWARVQPNVKKICMAQSTGIEIDRTELLYGAIGMTKVGGYFEMEV